jgi:hypothetical protein
MFGGVAGPTHQMLFARIRVRPTAQIVVGADPYLSGAYPNWSKPAFRNSHRRLYPRIDVERQDRAMGRCNTAIGRDQIGEGVRRSEHLRMPHSAPRRWWAGKLSRIFALTDFSAVKRPPVLEKVNRQQFQHHFRCAATA